MFYTMDCPASKDSPMHNTYAAMYETVVNGITWQAPGNQYEDQAWRLGGKSISGEDRYMYTVDAIQTTVSKVVVSHGDINGATVNSFTLNVYSSADLAATGGEGDVSSITGKYTANDDYTFSCPADADWTNCYYRFTWNITVTQASNKFIKLAGITFYNSGNSSVQKIKTSIVHPTADNNNGVINAELGMEDPFFGIFVINTADGSRIENPVLTYSSSNENVATIDENGDITLVGAGETTISATFAGDDTYYGSTGSYKLIVTDPDAVPVASLEEAFDAATTDEQDIYFDFTGLQVTAVNGSNAYLQDEDGFGAMIYESGHGYQVGQVLNGAANCKFKLYRGALEFMGVTSEKVPVEEATPEMQEVHQFYYETVTDLTPYNHGSFIKLENMTYTGQTANGNNINYNFTDATGAEFILYNTFKITMPELTEGATYTLNGIFVVFNETLEIAPRNADDIVIQAVNKQYPTYNVSGLESVTTNGEFPFTVETRASGLKVELEQTELAELIPGTVVGEYTLKTYGSEGDIILNISTEEDATYYDNEEPYNVHISFGQGGEEPQPTYNTVTWTLQNDQSTVSDDYAEWTHKDVKLTYEKNQSNTPVSQGVNADYGHTRFYANTTVSIVPSDGVEIAYVTFTTVGGSKYYVSADQAVENGSVEVDGTAVKLTPTDGTKAIVLVMANQVRATDMTVYYTGEGPEVVELQDAIINVDGITDGQVAQAGEVLSFTVNTRSQSFNVAIDNEKAAQLVPGTTIYDDYTLNTTNAGTVVVTITTDADNTYKAGTKTITITVVDATEPQFEIQDGVFDFTAGVDYGSNCPEGTSNNIKMDEYTWIAGNVTLVTGGRHIWNEKSELKLYKSTTSQPTAGFVTLSVPQGYVITSVAFRFGQKQNLAEQDGFDAEAGTWTGKSQSVTISTGTDRTDIDYIVVTYEEGTVPVEPTEVTIDVMNEDGTPMDEKIVMNVGETKNFMVYASNQAPVTYSGDNDKVATVEAAAAFDGGIITAKAAGTMTITFTVDATSNQPSAEKKITVTVVEPQQPDLAGLTAETAFTVEEAIAAIKAGVDANTDYYVKGLISKVDEIATETYSNATYWLADDMGADNQMLEVYRGKAFRGDGFNEGNASLVTVGNEVVVKGKLTYYDKNDVYEFSSNSQLVSVKFDFLTVKSGDHGTICLPYDATVEGATVYEVAGVVKDDADNLSDLVLTEHEGNLLAGVPYVYKATADNIAVTYLASAIVTYGYGATGLQGTLAETPQKVEAGNYILYNNVLRKVGDDADAKIAKYHAYFDLTNVATFNPENTADVKYISISFDEDATGITELTEKTESTEGAIYNLQGQRVNSLQRGINIVGGKKVLVK